MLYGCRQLVLWGVGLSFTTSTTLIICNGGDSDEIAGGKSDECEDCVKSLWPLFLRLYVCYNGLYKTKRTKQVSVFGLKFKTRFYEVGIA